MEQKVPQEQRKLVRAWIWLWYNDMTRLFGIMFGGHLLVTGPVLYFAGVPPEHMAKAVSLVYFMGFMFALVDNDYSNLRRIGRDEYRHRLPLEQLRDGAL